MKRFVALGFILSVTTFFAGCSTSPTRSAGPGMTDRTARLQITVDVPPTMNLLIQEDVAEAFAYRVSAALHEQGLRGRIRYVERGEEPVPGVPMLAVMLREWRVDRIGNVDCTFTAELRTPSGNRNLGAFTGTSIMTWSRRDWFDRQRDFEEAARDALSNLGRRIIDSGLVPDMQAR